MDKYQGNLKEILKELKELKNIFQKFSKFYLLQLAFKKKMGIKHCTGKEHNLTCTEVAEWIEYSILRKECKFQDSRATRSVERKKLQKHVRRTLVMQRQGWLKVRLRYPLTGTCINILSRQLHTAVCR